MGIKKPQEITYHPLVGQIFENLLVIECLKAQLHQGETSSLYFFQDSNRNEIDILYRKADHLKCFEVKSTSADHPSMRRYLQKVINNYPQIKEAHLIYNGKSRSLTNNIKLIHFKKAFKFFVTC